MERVPDQREAKLEEAWGRLLSRLTLASATDPIAAKRVKWLRRDVINRYRSSATAAEAILVEQAHGLSAWMVDAKARGNNADPLQVDWPKLRGDCNHLIEELGRDRGADRPLLMGLLKSTQDIEPLLEEVRNFLERCRHAFGSVQRFETVFRAEREIIEIEKDINARVAELPADWPSVRLARFQAQLHERNKTAFGRLLDEVTKVGAKSFAEWRTALADPALAVPPEAHAVLIAL